MTDSTVRPPPIVGGGRGAHGAARGGGEARTAPRGTRYHPLALLGALLVALTSACDRGGASQSDHAPAAAPAAARDAAPSRAAQDPPPPADRVAARRVVTFYQWQRTEPGTAETDNQSIEHGATKLHLVYEVHRDPQNRGWLTVSALAGTVAVPENLRMRPTNATSEWRVPPSPRTQYNLEMFRGAVRTDEPVRVFLASAPDARVPVTVALAPTSTRVPATDTLAPTPEAATGQYDAIVVTVVPVTSRRGRYIVYALDLRVQPGGFPAGGVMDRAPTAQDVERYARWMRDPNGMGRSRPPPIAMRPIEL